MKVKRARKSAKKQRISPEISEVLHMLRVLESQADQTEQAKTGH